jgi:hypothetical protein
MPSDQHAASLLAQPLDRAAAIRNDERLTTKPAPGRLCSTVPRVRLSPDMTRGMTLLPIFLQSALPRIISSTDIQSSRDLPTELLVGIISSSLTASFYLVGDPIDGQTVDSTNAIGPLARGVAKGLQVQQSTSMTSRTILQRLSAMPVFCTHFPMFAQS